MAGLGDRPRPRSPCCAAGSAAWPAAVVLLGGARVLRIREVTSLVDTVAARLRRG